MKKSITVISTALFVGLLVVSKVIFGALQSTKNSFYLAVGHYLFDYFLYIQQITQGIRGHWLFNNPYSPGDQSKTFIAYGQFLLMGRIAKIFNLSPFFTYWLAVFVLTIILSLLIFYLIKRLLSKESFFIQFCAWILSLFATPFIMITNINNRLQIIPYDYWYAPMSIFQRFEVMPHHLTSSILIILILLLLDKIISSLGKLNWPKILKYTVIVCLLLVFLLTFAPFQVINLMSCLLIAGWIYSNLFLIKKNKKDLVKLFVFLGLILIVVFSSAVYIKISTQSIDYFNKISLWELTQQKYPGFWEIVAVTGPILIFVPFGIKRFFNSVSPLKFLFFFFTLISYIYFYSPLAVLFGSHNGRFVNPVVYIFFGVLSVLGMKAVTGLLTKKPILLRGLLIIFFGYFFVVTSIIYKSFPNVDEFSYLPKNLIMGIKVIDRYPDKKVILTSPMMPLGVIVPVIIDYKVYLGRSSFTPDYDNRTVIVDQFYRGVMTKEQAKKFVVENNIGYIILATLETNKYSNYKAGTLNNYGFLKNIYENNEVKIYQVL